jgi:predicted DsbA family dithiol-disulfide isomerase
LHPDSIRVVTILEATKKQDMFLESLEATLHFQNKWVGKPKHNIDALLEILSNLGLDMEKLKNDIKSSDVIKVVEEDIKDKNTLKIKKTPTYYINTKLLERYSLTNLRDTVLMELNK